MTVFYKNHLTLVRKLLRFNNCQIQTLKICTKTFQNRYYLKQFNSWAIILISFKIWNKITSSQRITLLWPTNCFMTRTSLKIKFQRIIKSTCGKSPKFHTYQMEIQSYTQIHSIELLNLLTPFPWSPKRQNLVQLAH